MGAIYDERNKNWTSSLDQVPFDDPQVSFGQRLLNGMAKNGSKVAQMNADTERQMTFYEMRLNTIRTAQNLQNRGFEPHQVFCFMVKQHDYLASTVLASFCLACPIAPLHPTLSKDEIVRILAKTKPSLVFCDSETSNQIADALNELESKAKMFTFGEHVNGLEPIENLLIETGNEDQFVPVKIDKEKDIAAIFCSSGTTGPSKCVCISYKNNLFKPSRSVDGVALSFDSIYWTVGIAPIKMCAESGMIRIITSRPFSPELQLHLIEKYNVSILMNPPFNMVACLKTDLIDKVNTASVKQILFYGSKLDNNLIADVKRHFPNALFISGYGMTEVGVISTTVFDSKLAVNAGQLCHGFIAKIVDCEGNRCGPNVSGEICVHFPNSFIGYLDEPELTASTIDNEGFFRTGDTGYFDENGILFFVDRIKNIIRVYYFRAVILPHEIEECLLSRRDIQEVCVVGVPVACGSALPAAVIVRKPNSKLSQREVFDFVAENLPNRSKLRGGVYFVDEFPRTHSGKIIRGKVTELVAEWFNIAKENVAHVQMYLSDIPEEFRKLI